MTQAAATSILAFLQENAEDIIMGHVELPAGFTITAAEAIKGEGGGAGLYTPHIIRSDDGLTAYEILEREEVIEYDTVAYDVVSVTRLMTVEGLEAEYRSADKFVEDMLGFEIIKLGDWVHEFKYYYSRESILLHTESNTYWSIGESRSGDHSHGYEPGDFSVAQVKPVEVVKTEWVAV